MKIKIVFIVQWVSGHKVTKFFIIFFRVSGCKNFTKKNYRHGIGTQGFIFFLKFFL